MTFVVSVIHLDFMVFSTTLTYERMNENLLGGVIFIRLEDHDRTN